MRETHISHDMSYIWDIYELYMCNAGEVWGRYGAGSFVEELVLDLARRANEQLLPLEVDTDRHRH